jgi:cell division inhibitor SepF
MPEDEFQRKSLWTRIKDGLLGVEEPEEDEVEAPAGGAGQRRPQTPLRLQTARAGRVAVRLNAQVFEDAKLAADGLKSGEHQIVNLEKATPQMAERIIDFLNGVCYALDGTVERVGERVYMFVPASVVVDIDNGAVSAGAGQRSTFGVVRE